ncbi:DNA methyltransferase [Acidocella sp.]|uniref:class I SAM-dependent DNA methyltransferase n=1 Tax=Acidocella sp. TaxID=50710 RepID=UPI002638574B|nr:DNA methyltransferase [Acidocella sp.]
MPLSWNEIRDRALNFSREWANETSEDAEAKSFWDAFFQVFGLSRRRFATFEEPVKKSDGHGGYIDLLWKGILLVEHKSKGKNLDKAFSQAKDYFPGLKDNDLPRYIIVSDFDRFRLYDLEEGTQENFALKDFYKNVKLFGFIAGYQTTKFKAQDPVNVEAAERMGKLHDRLKESGYEGHQLEVYLVRLLFCLFAEDTSIFERRQFQDLIEQRTREDGQDLAQWLETLFQVLNTEETKRLKTHDEQLKEFPYVNGNLFGERLATAGFNREMRDILLECCALDWSKISPAIFGALFQSVMDPKLRRNLGAHYTSEQNILKVIKPLFLEELWNEFEKTKGNKRKLLEFHQKLAKLTFLDPACGCGNFLVIAYRELRQLELEILRVLYPRAGVGSTMPGARQTSIDIAHEVQCDVDQFYGIEIEEFPAQIAATALWLMDHQMNMKVSEEFGLYYRRLPLRKSATIKNKNALNYDWHDIIQPQNLNFIFGNPPFVGAKIMNDTQRKEMADVFGRVKGAKLLDYVAGWYKKAADYMEENKEIRTAFVSTNSISQGEQVGALWTYLLSKGAHIFFGHRTFRWSNEASGMAAVHCVIIGFSLSSLAIPKRIFEYETPQSEAHEVSAKNINPYLADADDILIVRRSSPLCDVPEIRFGNQPIDGGHLLMEPDEKIEFLKKEPDAKKFIRRYVGSEEFINNVERWCLWLVNAKPSDINSLPLVKQRLALVKKFRNESEREATRNLASTPARFAFISHTETSYLIVPSVSSERRNYIPIGFMPSAVIASNLCLIIPGATLYHFGVISSSMHMAWVRYVCGRLESRYRYSNTIVYNNFPWPTSISDKQAKAIETAAQSVLDARSAYKESSLAELYDPLSMPVDLVKAHKKLDAAVEAAYRSRAFASDGERATFLFDQYEKLSSPLAMPVPKKTAVQRRKK